MYDALVWLAIVAAVIEFAASGSPPAGLIAVMVFLIQIGRIVRNRRDLSY